jgi:hypothetical protein
MHTEVWKLDTNLWEWSLLQLKGAKPDAREKSDCIRLDESRILVFGGYDGIRWLNDSYVFNIKSLECTQVKPSGSLPPPRSGHKLAMLHQGALLFGGETTNTQYLGDLWALRGLFEMEATGEAPKWVKMQLSGPSPSGCSGHGFVSAGAKIVVYGGRGDEGWLSRKTIYHKSVSVIDRESVRWVKANGISEEPSERAFHSLTLVGANKLLMFGGFNGKSTYGDLWFLELSDDPSLAARNGGASGTHAGLQNSNNNAATEGEESNLKKFIDPTLGMFGNVLKGLTPGKEVVEDSPKWMRTRSSLEQESMLGCLRQRLGLPRAGSFGSSAPEDPMNDVRLQILKIAIKVDPKLPKDMNQVNLDAALARARSFFSSVEPENLTSDDIQALLYDYKCILPSGLAFLRQKGKGLAHFGKWNHYLVDDLRVTEIPKLLSTYRELLSATLGM